ncbi:MAG: 3-oxoacyl-ACP reductase FabG [Candidatus Saganbacteria bacterium]|nr:3-oxoacyl-ACP reductase FabG [Candidatus Saganbacteria bacterium]
MTNNEMLKDKVCIVTGAGKGIGREVAGLFYGSGAKLALISRSKDDLESLVAEKKMSGSRVMISAGDVSDEAAVTAFVRQVIEKFGRIDVLVNNAGIRFRKSFMDIPSDEWHKVIWTNLGSTYLMCREAGRQMIKQKSGRIINMASVVGTLGLPDLSAYGASKGGIISLTKCLALEWAPYNINVNVLAPGFCETSYADNFKQKKELYQFTLDRTPQKRWGSARDVANACLFLSSDMSDYVTGEVLSVDGGWSAW